MSRSGGHTTASGLVRSLAVPAGLVLLGLAIYSPGLEIGYFGDDFGYVFRDPAHVLLRSFWWPIENGFYRPLQVAYLASIQSLFGLETLPLHLGQIVLHGVFCGLLYAALQQEGCSKIQSLLAALFMLASQENAHPVLSTDTSSQMMSSLFGFASLWMLRRCGSARTGGETGPFPRVDLPSLLLFVLALLGKESSVSFLALLGLLISVQEHGVRPGSRRVARVLVRLVPYLVVTAIYLALQSLLTDRSIEFTTGKPYGLWLGGNVLRNLGMLWLAVTTPVSSLWVFESLQRPDWRDLAVASAAYLAFAGVVLRGLWLSEHRDRSLFLVIAAVVCFFPTALLVHVSELYAYNSLPYVSALVGIGIGGQIEAARRRPVARGLLVGIAIALLLGHVLALRQKAILMDANGQAAWRLLAEIRPELETLAPNGTLVLLNPPRQRPEYSVFSMRGFEVLRSSGETLRWLLDRDDIAIRIVDEEQLDRIRLESQCLILTMDDRTAEVQRHEHLLCPVSRVLLRGGRGPTQGLHARR